MYSWTKNDRGILCAIESWRSWILTGLLQIAVGGAFVAVALQAAPGVGRVVGSTLGGFLLVTGVVSVGRRGWFRVDPRRREVELMIGWRKFLPGSRNISFGEISGIVVGRYGGRHTSYNVSLQLRSGSTLLLAQASDRRYVELLAGTVADEVGAPVAGALNSAVD